MNNDGDEVIFRKSTKDNTEPVLFNGKNYTYITDSTSNGGVFASNQVQFDLATLSSQSQWVSLNEGIIELPVKITATITQAAAGTPTGGSATILAAVIKNGWHQFIDSCQVVINGQTLQSAQSYESVAATYRILSTWSQDTLKQWGPTCGVALDDMTTDTQNTLSATTGLNNVPFTTAAPNTKGFDVTNSNATALFNKGIPARFNMMNNDIAPAAASLQTTVLGSGNMIAAGRANVAAVASGSATNTVGDSIYSCFALATVRLRDICDINQFPLTKNLKGYVYISFNNCSTVLSNSTGAATLTSVSYNINGGRSNPILINTGAIVIPTGSSTAGKVTVTATVDGSTTGRASTSAAPLSQNARLLVPYYSANPSIDAALTKTQYFSTFEKIVNPITVAAGANINYTVTVGVPNPRRLVLLPMYQNLGVSTPTPITNLSSPELSAFDSVPATSGPFCYLNNLQVYCANKPIFQYPVVYDFEMYNSEIVNLGANGAIVDELTSGLLTEQLWEQNHRYYSIDLSRRIESEDGQSKSIQVSFNNGSSAYGMKVIAIVFYEKKWSIDTALCQLKSA